MSGFTLSSTRTLLIWTGYDDLSLLSKKDPLVIAKSGLVACTVVDEILQAWNTALGRPATDLSLPEWSLVLFVSLLSPISSVVPNHLYEFLAL